MKYYIDCEFDGLNGPLLSMAIVSHTGKSMYVVTNYVARDPWVIEHVIPKLLDFPINQPNPCTLGADPPMVADALQRFFKGDEYPYVIADWPDDIKYLCQYMIIGGGQMIDIPGMKFAVKRVDAYPSTLLGAVQHNAWWDAMALRHLLSDGAR